MNPVEITHIKSQCVFVPKVTEIQNIQIGEGDVLRGIQIPIYMIFPRLFTCPTLITPNFKIGFLLLKLTFKILQLE